MNFIVFSTCLVATSLAEPHGYGLGVGVHPGHATSYVGPTTWGLPHYGKRSAEPHGYGLGVAVHPGRATSYVGPTTYGLPHYRKRSAEPHGVAVGLLNNNIHGLSHFGSGYAVNQLHPSGHSFQHVSQLHKRSAEPHGLGLGVAVHPGHATSYVGPTTYGLPHYGKREAHVPAWPAVYSPYGSSTCFGCFTGHNGKRSADAEPHGYGLGVAAHPGRATSYVGPTTYGLPHYGKRNAEPHGVAVGLLNNNIHGLRHFGSGYAVNQLHPSGHSFQHINRLHKRSAEPHGLGLGVAVHPGHATSYVGPTTYGLPHYGKREAEADPHGFYGYGYHGYGGYRPFVYFG